MKKKLLSLRPKLALFLSLVILSSFCVISYVYYSNNIREKQLENKINIANIKIIHSILKDNVLKQQNIVRDYAVWDEMYRAVQSKNSDWMKINMEAIRSSYRQDYFAVYDSQGDCLYNEPQDKILFSSSLVKQLKGNYGEFFILQDSVPIHVSWSITTFTADTSRIGQGAGYLFIADVWDTKFMNKFKATVGLDVFFSLSSHHNDFLTKVDFALIDVNGSTIADVYLKKDYSISKLRSSRNMMFFIVMVSMFFIFILFLLFIRKHITEPMRILVHTLKTGNVDVLKKMVGNHLDDEWTLILHLIQDNIKKKQQLKETIATKDKFFDLIAHDLRSPFNAIVGFSEMLADDKRKLSNEDITLYSHYILEASKNVNTLLSTLQEWARLQTGRWNPNVQPFALDKLVANVVSFSQLPAIHNKVTLFADIRGSFLVNADEHMVEIVLRNIIANAIKFTPPSGIIRVYLRQQEKEVIVTVSDSGKGMSPSIVKSLFKLGENVVSHYISGKLGTGLGLILSEELITKNGGKIWVKSELDKGSKFYFSLPLSV